MFFRFRILDFWLRSQWKKQLTVEVFRITRSSDQNKVAFADLFKICCIFYLTRFITGKTLSFLSGIVTEYMDILSLLANPRCLKKSTYLKRFFAAYCIDFNPVFCLCLRNLLERYRNNLNYSFLLYPLEFDFL